MPPKLTLREKIIRHSVMGPNGCWLWTGETRFGGYGYLAPTHSSRSLPKPTARRVHKVAYEQFVGPITAGLVVMHSCDVRTCVNPAHLSLGTHSDNVRDCVAKGRHGNQWRKQLDGHGPRLRFAVRFRDAAALHGTS